MASGAAPFLPYKNSSLGKNDRLCSPATQENDLFAARKRIVSDRARNAPLLHFNYRDTRKFMAQNTKGITTNDTLLLTISYMAERMSG